jgi:hypothetical protein
MIPAAMIPNSNKPPYRKPLPADEPENDVAGAAAGGSEPAGGARVSPCGDDSSAPGSSVVVRDCDVVQAPRVGVGGDVVATTGAGLGESDAAGVAFESDVVPPDDGGVGPALARTAGVVTSKEGKSGTAGWSATGNDTGGGGNTTSTAGTSSAGALTGAFTVTSIPPESDCAALAGDSLVTAVSRAGVAGEADSLVTADSRAGVTGEGDADS